MRRAALEEQNRFMPERQRQFRMAADAVTEAWFHCRSAFWKLIYSVLLPTDHSRLQRDF
jgi:hypothetical protein